MKLNNQEKETGILSEYEKTIFCRNKLRPCVHGVGDPGLVG